jgi:hypothetical protein
MMLISRLAHAALITVLAGAAGLSGAQGTAPSAKKDQVQKILQLQQSGIESVGVGLATQTATQVLQVASQAMGRVPADKREAVGAELQAEVRKFYDDVSPVLRASAVKLAPSTIGVVLEEKFSEDELKVLINWLESPVSRKYQQVTAELQQSLGQKLVAETRPQIEPKLKALEQVMGAKLAAAVGAAPAASGARAAAPAAKASGPVKK